MYAFFAFLFVFLDFDIPLAYGGVLNAMSFGIKDPEILETLKDILSGEVNEDAPTPEEEAEMEAVFEEIRKEDEANAALATEQKASVLDYLFPALFGVALLAFVFWYFFF